MDHKRIEVEVKIALKMIFYLFMTPGEELDREEIDTMEVIVSQVEPPLELTIGSSLVVGCTILV